MDTERRHLTVLAIAATSLMLDPNTSRVIEVSGDLGCAERCTDEIESALASQYWAGSEFMPLLATPGEIDIIPIEHSDGKSFLVIERTCGE